jgi:hypothetical protein
VLDAAGLQLHAVPQLAKVGDDGLGCREKISEFKFEIRDGIYVPVA